jgi:hypothetical protein
VRGMDCGHGVVAWVADQPDAQLADGAVAAFPFVLTLMAWCTSARLKRSIIAPTTTG